MVLVLARLDKRKTNVRRIVLIAVMTALSIVSRFIFAAVPAFKPMAAIIILTGMYLGCEAGFMCGALTAFLSNFYFGQGPWTPFQMVAFGLVGVTAGLLASSLKKRRIVLVIYGIVAGIFYSFFMDIWTMLWAYSGLNLAGYIAAIATAVPYTVLYAASNVVFLLLLERPFGRRLGRIIHKYRI
ncbi:MAG: ECF transporter S component [Lachnospiraceae bacterium]|nr:ECF transporter S component [Lachnospiraceae bacterium]